MKLLLVAFNCVRVCSSSPSPILEDDDKMNIDEEAVSKLLAKFFDQQHLKVCETQPQVMTPVTGQCLKYSCAVWKTNRKL